MVSIFSLLLHLRHGVNGDGSLGGGWENLIDESIYIVYTSDMTTKIQKWGNSLAVRLPKSLVDSAGFFQDAPVKIESVSGGIFIRPNKKQSTLSVILAKVTPENIQGEVNWGSPLGREKLPVWKNTTTQRKAK